jgi:hypothetical protein
MPKFPTPSVHDEANQMIFVRSNAADRVCIRVARFFLPEITKIGKIYLMTMNYTYQTAINYTK